MASLAKDIEKKIRNMGGELSAPHHQVMARLRLSGCTRTKLDGALDDLEERGKIKVDRNETHITLTTC